MHNCTCSVYLLKHFRIFIQKLEKNIESADSCVKNATNNCKNVKKTLKQYSRGLGLDVS